MLVTLNTLEQIFEINKVYKTKTFFEYFVDTCLSDIDKVKASELLDAYNRQMSYLENKEHIFKVCSKLNKDYTSLDAKVEMPDKLKPKRARRSKFTRPKYRGTKMNDYRCGD